MKYFIDIETVRKTKDIIRLDATGMVSWVKLVGNRYPEYGLNDNSGIEDLQRSWEDKAAFHPEFSRIVCITVGYMKEGRGVIKSYYGNSEESILADFAKMLVGDPNAVLVAHNGKGFDFPFICKRMIVNGILIPTCLNIAGKKPWEIAHEDTMEMWKFGGFSSSSLDAICYCLGVDTPKGDMDGSKVAECYFAGDHNRIARYCYEDVRALMEFYTMITGSNSIQRFEDKTQYHGEA